ncbi:hypothetical protein AB0911_38685 [Streptomyces nigra]|uniref:hypothetical protein n=1 Tax=Streptomyces nigra TaxID=1827580 RepID=UPI00345632B0
MRNKPIIGLAGLALAGAAVLSGSLIFGGGGDVKKAAQVETRANTQNLCLFVNRINANAPQDPLCIRSGNSIDDLSSESIAGGIYNDAITDVKNATPLRYCLFEDAFFQGDITMLRPNARGEAHNLGGANDSVTSLRPCTDRDLEIVLSETPQ